MNARTMIDGALGGCLSALHAKLAEAVKVAVNAALKGGHLSLSLLARSVESTTAMRHRIKRIDRLLGNRALHYAREDIYRQVAAQWLAGLDQALVVVDWSDATTDQRWHLLRASVAVEGRSVTVYEEVHPQRALGSRAVHRRFLKRLATVLPPGCKPIIMSDAGFHSTWFDLVAECHWQWIGRIRGKDMVSIAGGPWQRCSALQALAKTDAQAFPDVLYVRSNPTACRLVLVKRKAKGRKRLNRMGKRSRAHTSLKSARRAREPWLLACSPDLAGAIPEAIVSLYAKRMRIEESFRDLKNERGGLGLSATHSRTDRRLEVLLLIGHLTGWLMRLIGECAQQCHMETQFQSVAHPDHKEISALTLARRVIDAGMSWLKRLRPKDGVPILHQQAMQALDVI